MCILILHCFVLGIRILITNLNIFLSPMYTFKTDVNDFSEQPGNLPTPSQRRQQ